MLHWLLCYTGCYATLVVYLALTMSNIVFAPAMSLPSGWDPVKMRVSYLKELLEDKDPVVERQKKNIVSALDLYDKGELPKPGFSWFVDGTLCSSEPTSVPYGS